MLAEAISHHPSSSTSINYERSVALIYFPERLRGITEPMEEQVCLFNYFLLSGT